LRAKKDHPITGTVEIRNLHVTAYEPAHFAAYDVITSSASTSRDGKTLYIIVFNKDLTNDIPVQIALTGARPVTAVRRWTVTGPNLAALNFDQEEVREVESGVAMPSPQGGKLQYTAPARSMTALEVTMK
jgi:alpha-N-arabinofuranosidase